jgi:hypothetical protein
LRLAVHDVTRVEWSASIQLPLSVADEYTLTFELEVPASAFARHAPWNQLQTFARLDGPLEGRAADGCGKKTTLDGIRSAAVAFSDALLRALDAFKETASLAVTGEDELFAAIDRIVAVATDTRACLVAPADGDPAEITLERALVDEFVSVRLLDALTRGEEQLGRGEAARDSAHAVAARYLADRVDDEVRHRVARGFVALDPADPRTLECFVDRAARLKKHFQEVLFLDHETYQVDERIHNWSAAFMALLASTWAFAWQFALNCNARGGDTRLGSGLVALATIAALIYATKDRLKEIGRNWIAGRVRRLYAQRVTRYRTRGEGRGAGTRGSRAPYLGARVNPLVVTVRESIDLETRHVADPLNPATGATLPVVVIRYVHKGRVSPRADLTEAGLARVKHVFRYDLSPMFAWLDDSVKPVPVLDASTRRVRFVDAPRIYRLPVRVTLKTRTGEVFEAATLLVHKNGIARLDRRSAPVPLESGARAVSSRRVRVQDAPPSSRRSA